MSSDFSAGPQAVGYLYQARYALCLLLYEEEEVALSIEQLDDVAFERSHSPYEQLQLKHHLKNPTGLTDTSVDLWKTLRVWSTQYCEGVLPLPMTKLSVVTTSEAPSDSIASLLRPGNERNPTVAAARMTEIAATSTNQALKAAFEAFRRLSDHQREVLASCIYVFDGSPNIVDTGARIRKRLSLSVRKHYVDGLLERLEGWWFERVVRHLTGVDCSPISRDEVWTKVMDIADGFKPEALPIDFLDSEPPSIPDPDRDRRVFVLQLRAIALRSKRIEKAIRDYYRAYEQRSRWVREELLINDELERYERRLVDEWERFCLAAIDRHQAADENALQRCGREIFDWMDLTANFPIRPLVTEPYVMRGSYHMLANADTPRVWWHPKFLDRLQVLLTGPLGDVV